VSICFAAPVWVAFEQRFFSFSQMAFLEALSYAILILLQLPSGVIADLIGRKRVILFGWAVIGASNIFMGLAGSANLFILGYVAYSMGAAFVSGADVSILLTVCASLKGRRVFKSKCQYGTCASRRSYISAFGRRIFIFCQHRLALYTNRIDADCVFGVCCLYGRAQA